MSYPEGICTHCGDMPSWTEGPRLGTNHIALRFGGEDPFHFVYLDGEKQRRCIEALAGPDGAVLRTPRENPLSIDTCGECYRGFMVEEVRGDVRVEPIPPRTE